MAEQEFGLLNINGTEYKTIITDKFKNRKNWEKANPNLIKAYIPGSVNELFVKEGQKVKEGAKLMILEAMKMKNIIASPASGTIKSINVKVGDSIPKNTVLIEIE